MPQGPPSSTAPTVRWRGLLLLTVPLVVVWVGIWLVSPLQRQLKVMLTYPLVLVAVLGLLLWLLRSGLPRRTRTTILLGAATLAALFLTTFRFSGFTGDLEPIFAPRWGGPATRAADVEGISANDFPEFLGPGRSAVLADRNLAGDWSATPPEELWRRPIGEGWSGFAVLGDRAVTLEQSEEGEFVTAVDLRTGETLWSTRHDDPFTSSLGGNGPRATPTLRGDGVWAASGAGTLSHLDLATGELRWSVDFVADTGATLPEWGHSGSPLVLGNVVVVNAGGPGALLVAYDRDSGERRWSAGDDAAGYSSPFLTRRAGVDQIVSLNAASVTGHSPIDGRVLWRHPWPGGAPNVAQPLPLGDDLLLVSSGYGVGAELLRLARRGDDEEALEVTSLWQDDTLKSKFSNMVPHDGRVYGLDEGIMVCIDPETGERCWKGGRYGHGQLLLVDDLLLVQGERGEVFLVDPDPAELRELGSFRALPRKAWNTPALAGNVYLVRNHREATAFVLPTV